MSTCPNPIVCMFYISLLFLAMMAFWFLNDYYQVGKEFLLKDCDFNVSDYPSSRSSDVVFFSATEFKSGFYLSVKSLRATGAKCQIIVFVPHNMPISWQDQSFIDKFHLTVVRKPPPQGNSFFVPHLDRYNFELDWLRTHSASRVLHSDSYDVFFQADPFSGSIPSDSLFFVVEPHCFHSCGWNLAWLKECYGDSVVMTMMRDFIICSGTIGGNSSFYLKLLELMISTKEWEKCHKPSMDQPILNYLVWKGEVEKAGIPYRLIGCDEGFLTMQWCTLEHRVIENQYGQVLSPARTVPSYIHQYNRFDELSADLMEKCWLD